MYADAVRFEPAIPCEAFVDLERLTDVDAELVFAQARRNVRVRLRKNIGIHAQSEPGSNLDFSSTCSEKLKFCFTLHIEFEDAGAKSLIDLRRSLTHARENNSIDGFWRCDEHPLKLRRQRQCQSPCPYPRGV